MSPLLPSIQRRELARARALGQLAVVLLKKLLQQLDAIGGHVDDVLHAQAESIERGSPVTAASLITEIEIADVTTYPAAGERLTDLEKVNYLFGHNGCGKTTISRGSRARKRIRFRVTTCISNMGSR